MKAGVTGAYFRGIICPNEVQEEYVNRVKNWPVPYCDIPVFSVSEMEAMLEEEKQHDSV